MDTTQPTQAQDPTGDYLKDFAMSATLANVQNYVTSKLQELDKPQ